MNYGTSKLSDFKTSAPLAIKVTVTKSLVWYMICAKSKVKTPKPDTLKHLRWSILAKSHFLFWQKSSIVDGFEWILNSPLSCTFL